MMTCLLISLKRGLDSGKKILIIGLTEGGEGSHQIKRTIDWEKKIYSIIIKK